MEGVYTTCRHKMPRSLPTRAPRSQAVYEAQPLELLDDEGGPLRDEVEAAVIPLVPLDNDPLAGSEGDLAQE